MTLSSLQFARAFGALKAALAARPVGDHRLLALAAFWPNLAAYRANPSYQSYLDEYTALFAESLAPEHLADCPPENLAAIRTLAREIGSPEQRETVDLALARAWAYAGETERAVMVCAQGAGEVAAAKELFSSGADANPPMTARGRPS
mgnify:FL=1